MRAGKDLTEKPIYSLTDGRLLGKVKDLYLDSNLERVVGLYLGSEGIFSRKNMLINRDRVTLFGVDAVLVADSEVVLEEAQVSELDTWVRRQDLAGRDVDTPGGTRVGIIGDILVNDEGTVVGFKLARTFVEGPISRKHAVAREVVVDTGGEDGVMTIDLPRAEQHDLSAE
ncbi:MAG: PRC-barrel domain-containing protein [Anaerolineae bacterium]|nr:PRC-barrel domain-containing protein [Anaerolineae bacterium]